MTGRKVASKYLHDIPLSDLFSFKMSRDATPFKGVTMEDITKELVKAGIPGCSEERVIDGRTGQMTSALVFVGINYYQRLKHMGCDKISSRSKGQREKLTRQPLEGRSAGGGMRIGWQERDNFLANGATSIVKDRMMDNSDASILCVCKLCGYPAIHVRGKPEYGITDRAMCNVCDTDQVVYINIPYATKLYIQESLAMGIGIRVIPESSKYVVISDDQSILGEGLLII
jgi:DNA-directed RNA polymerase beta subunit